MLKGSMRISEGTAGCFQEDGVLMLHLSDCPNVPIEFNVV